MPRVRSQKVRQALLETGILIGDPEVLPEKIQLFTSEGEPISLGGGYQRKTLIHTTAVLAANAIENSALSAHPGWRAFKIQTNRPARVRVYPTAAQRAADSARPIGTKPTGDHGRLLEVVTSPGLLSYVLTPAVDMNSAVEGSGEFYIAVTNLDAAAGAVVTTFEYVRTE